jgi:hypothetical protein
VDEGGCGVYDDDVFLDGEERDGGKVMIPLVLSSRFVLYNISDVDCNTN